MNRSVAALGAIVSLFGLSFILLSVLGVPVPSPTAYSPSLLAGLEVCVLGSAVMVVGLALQRY